MKTMEQLEKAYEKEKRLTEQHKKNATDLKKQMEQMQGKNINQKVASLKMSAEEFDSFMKLLNSGKKNVLDAVNLIIGEKKEGVKMDADTEEEAQD